MTLVGIEWVCLLEALSRPGISAIEVMGNIGTELEFCVVLVILLHQRYLFICRCTRTCLQKDA